MTVINSIGQFCHENILTAIIIISFSELDYLTVTFIADCQVYKKLQHEKQNDGE